MAASALTVQAINLSSCYNKTAAAARGDGQGMAARRAALNLKALPSMKALALGTFASTVGGQNAKLAGMRPAPAPYPVPLGVRAASTTGAAAPVASEQHNGSKGTQVARQDQGGRRVARRDSRPTSVAPLGSIFADLWDPLFPGDRSLRQMLNVANRMFEDMTPMTVADDIALTTPSLAWNVREVDNSYQMRIDMPGKLFAIDLLSVALWNIV
jgi:hypothetical protein